MTPALFCLFFSLNSREVNDNSIQIRIYLSSNILGDVGGVRDYVENDTYILELGLSCKQISPTVFIYAVLSIEAWY